MYIEFLGAARCVTGSCYLLSAEGEQVLIDCGMRQGNDAQDAFGERSFPFVPSEVDCVVLTHAHIDHSGLVPLLVKAGFNGRIVCTEATRDLCSIMLPDSGHIQEIEAQWHNRKRERSQLGAVEPLYTARDAIASLQNFQGVSYGEQVQLTKHMEARFVSAGHMLGSASVELWLTEGEHRKKIVFSGDIGNIGKPLVDDPGYIASADIVVMESTYGDRLHGVDQSGDKLHAFLPILRDTFKRGGNVVIPAFAVGRTQEVLYDIGRIVRGGMLPEITALPVVVDSPLAVGATRVFKKHMYQYFDDEALQILKSGQDPLDFPLLRMAESTEESKAINDMAMSQVIISASGMCEAGRIKHHLKHNLWRRESSIVFVGYQAMGTLGRRIQEGARSVRIFGEEIGVRAQIHTIPGYSGHADKTGLMKWAGSIQPPIERIYMVHGESGACEALAEAVRGQFHVDALAPRLLERYDLITGRLVSRVSVPREKPLQETVWQVEDLRERVLAFMKQTDLVLKGLDEARRQRLLSLMAEDLQPLVKKWEREMAEL